MNNVLDNLGLGDSDTIRRIVRNTFIVEYGIIKDIPADGIVTVETSVADDAENIVITDCILVNIASSLLTVNVVPKVDDKVLILFPRRFSGTMFAPSNNEPVITGISSGYSMLGGIAILMNQYSPSSHKNLLNVSDDGMVLTAWNSTVNIGSDDTISVSNGKAEISADADGNITVNSMDGLITLKNNKGSLFTILNDMLTTLNTTLKTQGSPASHVVVPNQFQQQSTDLGNLMKA